ncbi:hypothetical protein [Kibdelosporangium phytohabitans]|uniref:Uncharacterized protein n=1 Tax=Kibdelosporangium phytohabitans TaxID=860235 RepID=A0A0N9HJ09_9PSEU|nr:hypothetical protein [Kibdelosporangium phytohabitans]ALG05982.1 hypothetical protein AOZ06_02750 [Kibdelosporangium phytohabitans]MBE1465958.1 hypothetical protein [Kibdelosporangium phytohabitans]
MEDEGPSPNTGVARLVVLLCAFGLATVGAFSAFFATEILAAVLGSTTRPSTGSLVLCALVPIAAAVGSVVVSIRVKAMGKVLALGCGTLILGAMATTLLMVLIAA